MTEAAAAPVEHRTYPIGQWPQLSEEDRKVIQELGQIGIPRHAAGILISFLRNGQDKKVTSYWLEHVTDARQPEISLALAWLTKENQVRSEREIRNESKGRPLKVFALNAPVEVFVRRKIIEYRQQAESRVAQLEKVFPGVS